MQRTLVRFWSRKLPMLRNNSAHVPQLLSPYALEPVLCNEKPSALQWRIRTLKKKKKKRNLKEKRCTSQRGVGAMVWVWPFLPGLFPKELFSVHSSSLYHIAFHSGADVFPLVLTPLTSASILQHSSTESVQVTKLVDFPECPMSGWLPSEGS